MVVSAGPGAGLTSVALGLARAFQHLQMRVGFAKPLAQRHPADRGPERSTSLARSVLAAEVPDPLDDALLVEARASGDTQPLLERVVAQVQRAEAECDVVVIEGLVATAETAFAQSLNAELARALDAQVVMAVRAQRLNVDAVAAQVALQRPVFEQAQCELIGAVVNRVELPPGEGLEIAGTLLPEAPLPPVSTELHARFSAALEANSQTPLLGLVPDAPVLEAPRVRDLARALGATVWREGELDRRITGLSVAAMTVPNAVSGFLPGNLVITPGDRIDIILGVAMAALSGVRMAGLVLCGDLPPDPRLMAFCELGFATGLPVLQVKETTIRTAQAVSAMDREVPVDDGKRAELVMNSVAQGIDLPQLQAALSATHEAHLSPPAFRHSLIQQSRAAGRRIVLPEATEPRTLTAAALCAQRGLAECLLVGERARIEEAAQRLGICLGERMRIVDAPTAAERFVQGLVARRKHKGMTPAFAREALKDPVVLATMMVAEGEADGLVSGAEHTTADTVRPALQLIRTAPDAKLVSSVFFMCLPQQVVVYGDCAVNPDPSAEELADIALQSARSAETFGITPRVAMISYSTGDSGQGENVDKVRQATGLARQARPELLIDGPLQYDAAFDPDVARKKAPDSPVAGRATVFVFPDLNTGNTTYKAVQRSAQVVSIGPMLQGLAKPVNDLSRGALVDDIVFTIALTAIQASRS